MEECSFYPGRYCRYYYWRAVCSQQRKEPCPCVGNVRDAGRPYDCGDWDKPSRTCHFHCSFLSRIVGMAIGNVVGSNLFNLLLILGVSSTIHPIAITMASFVDLVMALAVTLLGFCFVCTGKRVNRIEGGIMVALYIAYTVYAIIR